MEYPQEKRIRSINARAESTFIALWLENFHISCEGYENTFAICLPSFGSALQK